MVQFITDHPFIWLICSISTIWLLIRLGKFLIGDFEYWRIKWEWRDTPKNRKRKGYNK